MSKKCKVVRRKFVEPCDTLKAAAEYGNPRGKAKGVFAWALHDAKTHAPSRTFFGVKSGEHTANGVAFAYCPFCGEGIDAPYAANEDYPDRARSGDNVSNDSQG